MDVLRFLDTEDDTERNVMIHIADEILLRRAEEREDQAIRTINALGKQIK